MSKLNILIISANSASSVLAIADEAIICVPESQVKIYQRYNPDAEIVGHPDDISEVFRFTWAVEKFDSDIFFLSGTESVIRMTAKRKEDAKVDPSLATELIKNAHFLAEETGGYLFGFNSQTNPGQYSGLVPYRAAGLKSSNCLPMWGLGLRRGSKLWFNPEFEVFQGAWLFLLNAVHHRHGFFDDRFAFVSSLEKIGSQSACEVERLQQLFGRRVVKKGKIYRNQ